MGLMHECHSQKVQGLTILIIEGPGSTNALSRSFGVKCESVYSRATATTFAHEPQTYWD